MRQRSAVCSSTDYRLQLVVGVRVLLSVRFVAGRDDCSSGTGLPTRGVVDESSLGSRVRRPVPPLVAATGRGKKHPG